MERDKLLHERFRDDASMGEQTFSPEELLAFADEIERFYIPRPRFEDGEPVRWGETEIEWDADEEYPFNAISESGYPIAKGVSIICAYAKMTKDGFVKRKEYPDTLESIEDDATMLPYGYCLKHGISLSALPDMEEATISMIRDLLRRQREVLK